MVSTFLNVRVADIQACYELWKSRGAEFLSEPKEKYGEKRADGSFRWYLTRAVPMLDGTGGVIKWLGTSTDVDDRKQAEEVMQRSRDEMKEEVGSRTAELLLLMEYLEKGRDDLRNLASELVMAEERERKRIGVTLHDEIAQTLAAARMRIDLLRRLDVDDEHRQALALRLHPGYTGPDDGSQQPGTLRHGASCSRGGSG